MYWFQTLNCLSDLFLLRSWRLENGDDSQLLKHQVICLTDGCKEPKFVLQLSHRSVYKGTIDSKCINVDYHTASSVSFYNAPNAYSWMSFRFALWLCLRLLTKFYTNVTQRLLFCYLYNKSSVQCQAEIVLLLSLYQKQRCQYRGHFQVFWKNK